MQGGRVQDAGSYDFVIVTNAAIVMIAEKAADMILEDAAGRGRARAAA